jgi:protein involved in polysaccharide export with SLBB domain
VTWLFRSKTRYGGVAACRGSRGLLGCGVRLLIGRGETKIARRALLQTSCLGLVVAGGTFGLAQMARAAGDYRLDTGDKIKITIVGEEQGSGIYEVDTTGSISTGLISRVSV